MDDITRYLYDEKKDLDPEGKRLYFDRGEIARCFHDLSERGGRGRTLLFTDNQNHKLVLRHYFRGGLTGKLLKDRFLRCERHAHRAFEEYKLLAWMADNGLNVPRPVIAREIQGPLTLTQDIVIEQIEHSTDLAGIIARRHLTVAELQNIGAEIKKMFALGVDHTDLNIRNILLTESGRVYLIDFDKCFKTVFISERKRAIIERLKRSFMKECGKTAYRCYYSDQDFRVLREVALA